MAQNSRRTVFPFREAIEGVWPMLLNQVPLVNSGAGAPISGPSGKLLDAKAATARTGAAAKSRRLIVSWLVIDGGRSLRRETS